MNLTFLLVSCLILLISAKEDVHEFTHIVDMANAIKNLLDKDTTSYKITWDTSLALYASERVDTCHVEVSKGEMFVKSEDLMNLALNLNSIDSFSLDPLPTIAIFRNNAARIHLDIGSRIGCAFKNCSSGNDLFCVFDSRKDAQNRLERQVCVKDLVFPNLCEEKPVDFWNMEQPEFQWNMMQWNEMRRALAKEFSVSGMYQLTWSEEAVRFAHLLGSQCDPNCTGTHFHMHSRDLEPLAALWIITHEELDGSKIFGNTTMEMFAPQRKEFGCVPLDPSICKDYSFICVLGPDWSSSLPITIPTGRLCGECPGRCDDGLCQTVTEGVTSSESLNETSSVGRSTRSPPMLSETTWKTLAVLLCFIGAATVAMLLLYILVTEDYHF
ncbi:hypothetical protein CAEBREN_29151 [Caenorhabditis brenneri]|uniref:SCP domain-containing protein n=1 Tax=Caenorhabditis brenneri TaxID=135651 RepID=G0MRK9_CAEBE|nr:hypothetical protein CAEBREN_29151 [Caenorhabditis brenneri]